MLAHSRHHTHVRRGIVLVLVLAMLGLLALIGVTFATFSGQAKINARNTYLSVIQAQDDELMDFALSQLIQDTGDVRSVIRGHSLARDMYGNDANFNGFFNSNPSKTGPTFLIQNFMQESGNSNYYDILTNIPIPGAAFTWPPGSNNTLYDSTFYGYNFTRWILRLTYVAAGLPHPVDQTFEILFDDNQPNSNATQFSGQGFHVFRVVPTDPNGTTLTNLTAAALNNWSQTSTPLVQPGVAGSVFTLDGRWLRAFNGAGMGANAVWGNFRFNGSLIAGNPNFATPGAPGAVGMDEDYDACDLENWFLAIQSADGNVIIPSFHRPGILRYDPANNVSDWTSATPDSMARILRPRRFDGNDPATFPDLVPGPNGKITYDVDNDGDGITDSVWLDLGYPARRDSRGQLYKPLFAFLVIGLNGRIPLNTAGNLAAQSGNATNLGTPLYSQAEHLGNSVSEVDPTYGLQNAFRGDFDPFNQLGNGLAPGNYNQSGGTVTWGPSSGTYNSQVDNTTVYSTSITPNGPAYQPTDVRLTQLRNLLAGTRPQNIPLPLTAAQYPANADPTGAVNGDDNFVYGAFPGVSSVGTGNQAPPYFMPNSIADFSDIPIYTDANGNPYVQRTTTPVAGRWGESQSIPGPPIPNPNGPGATPPAFNWLQYNDYTNPVRAGYSFDITDLLKNLLYSGSPIFARDAADDNFNTFDPYTVLPTRIGEINDQDYYDASGGLLLPVDRMRRWVTPADINGTGRVAQFTVNFGGGMTRPNRNNVGPDNYGRVQFSSYFRPPGAPGLISIEYNNVVYNGNSVTTPPTASPVPAQANLGQIYYPSDAPYYSGAVPNPINPIVGASGTPSPPATTATNYLPDLTNNPLHGFESYKIPNLFQNPGNTPGYVTQPYFPQNMGGMPIDQGALSTNNTAGNPTVPAGFTGPPASPAVPATFPTYDVAVNSTDRSDGMNDADEMNLYVQNPLLDSPFGPSDLEWLYRQQDVDGATLTSRLAQLAPISFTNTIDGQRRRRLYAIDSWELNNFVWANDNPGNVFPNNSRFAVGQNASMVQASLNTNSVFVTPSLAQRDKKINLNYPLPVSNDPNEPVRHKWISDAYQLLKVVLPPKAVDTPEELAQLSQFLINIIDFRDPDATMTHWVNPDVFITPSQNVNAPPTLSIGSATPATQTIDASIPLDQYGMEYNPVAINEVLAYTFQTRVSGTLAYNSRFFIELVNTLTAAYNPNYDYGNPPATNPVNNYYGNASVLNLGGFNSANYVTGDPYSGGCWDLVFTPDTPQSRPDPYRGELLYNNAPGVTSYYGLIPLTRDAFGGATTTAPNQGDVTLLPMNPNPPGNTPATPMLPVPQTLPGGLTIPPSYYYVIGNPQTVANSESNPPSTTASTASTGQTGNLNNTYYYSLTRTLATGYNPLSNTTAPSTTNTVGFTSWRPGILPLAPSQIGAQVPPPANPPANYASQISVPTVYGATGTPPVGGHPGAAYYWVCLRRPANPFAPVSLSNPMCVVDAMRFPYIDGTGYTTTVTDSAGNPATTGPYNTIFSAQRLQPYRGGHAVPVAGVTTGAANANGMITTTATTTPVSTPDPRYGYSEQIAVPQSPPLAGMTIPSTPYNNTMNYGIYYLNGNGKNPATNVIMNTLGLPNDSAENWDYLVFNDRDFTSVAELMLVPGCPPGLFTKQFVEYAPSMINAANIFSAVTPVITPISTNGGSNAAPNPVAPGAQGGNLPSQTPLVPAIVAVTTGGTVPFNTATPVTVTASLPFLSISNATAAMTSGQTTVPGFPTTSTGTTSALTLAQPTTGISTPVQPHSFPYLVDKFFYTGASNFYYPPTQGSTDPGGIVGGPASDGWFKMFDFFEVPSQSIGAIGPVASGTNFDWARQDTKPGLLNLNLIIDEEVFFSVFGEQSGSFNLPTVQVPPGSGTLYPTSYQTRLNSTQLPYLWNSNTSSLPYTLPLSTFTNGGAQPAPPISYEYPPVPLVVSALQANGAPNYVYPITDQTPGNYQGGIVDNDPILASIYAANATTTPSGMIQPPVDNRIKAAFAQFLWLRHGGSGYLFGFGQGNTGQNTAVVTQPGQVNNQPIPAERPFHSLSYPDIDFTIMRPAALPPSQYTNPPVLQNAASITMPGTINGATYQCYAPYVTPNNNAPFTPGPGNAQTVPVVYTGDPGVRNPLLSQGYVTGSAYPAPIGVEFPAPNTPTPDLVVLPPPIPSLRLFQVPDAYGQGSTLAAGYSENNIPPSMSNAGDTGDPYINSQIPYIYNTNLPTPAPTPTQPVNTAFNGVYSLNNGFNSLAWSGGVEYLGGATPGYAPIPAPGALPPTTVLPLGANGPVPPTTATNASAFFPTAASGEYLGANSSGGNTDDRQHPFWRSELMQKAMNLTTVRTHQYAVWITIGFFEIKRQGDIAMLAQGNPQLAFDVMGPEVGALSGKNTRFRGFFLVDRLKVTGFDPGNIASFRAAVVYRKVIQ